MFLKNYVSVRAPHPSFPAAAISLTCPIFDISQRPPSSILRRTWCSSTRWSLEYLPRSSHCAEHKVRKKLLPEPSFRLPGTCSPACAEYTIWMNGVPPRSSRCAKHRVRNTWLRCLRRTWYLATSTGRCGPLAQAKHRARNKRLVLKTCEKLRITKLSVAVGKCMIFTILVPSGPQRSA